MVTIANADVGFHHVGITVADRDRSVAFWTCVLGVEPLWVQILDGQYLGAITGYEGIHLKAAMLPLPGGGRLEILEYLLDEGVVAGRCVGSTQPLCTSRTVRSCACTMVAQGGRAFSTSGSHR